MVVASADRRAGAQRDGRAWTGSRIDLVVVRLLFPSHFGREELVLLPHAAQLFLLLPQLRGLLAQLFAEDPNLLGLFHLAAAIYRLEHSERVHPGVARLAIITSFIAYAAAARRAQFRATHRSSAQFG